MEITYSWHGTQFGYLYDTSNMFDIKKMKNPRSSAEKILKIKAGV